jgi:hypothetical protein
MPGFAAAEQMRVTHLHRMNQHQLDRAEAASILTPRD